MPTNTLTLEQVAKARDLLARHPRLLFEQICREAEVTTTMLAAIGIGDLMEYPNEVILEKAIGIQEGSTDAEIRLAMGFTV